TLPPGTPSIQVAKAVTPQGAVQTGTILTYLIQTTNNGNVPITNLTVTDAVPAGTTYVSGGTLSGSTVTFPATTLNPGQTVTSLFTVSVTSTAAGTTISNIATVSGGGISQVTNSVANTVGQATPTSATLQATLQATPPSGTAVQTGSTIHYVITLTN